MFKKVPLATAIALASVVVSPAMAADEYNVPSGLTAAAAPLALQGIDTVAFIKNGNRIEGSAKFSAVYDGVAYYFSNETNLETFQANPSQYIAQNGGFCTFGVAVSKKFDGDPRWADVRNGKLYVFLNEDIFNAYQKDPDGTIAKAKTNWKKIHHTAATEL